MWVINSRDPSSLGVHFWTKVIYRTPDLACLFLPPPIWMYVLHGCHVPRIILVLSDAKVSVAMTIWIALADLMRLNYLCGMCSLANCLVVLVRTRSIHMQLECGLPLDVGQWQITTISTFLKISYNLVWVLLSRSGTLHHFWACLGCDSQKVACWSATYNRCWHVPFCREQYSR